MTPRDQTQEGIGALPDGQESSTEIDQLAEQQQHDFAFLSHRNDLASNIRAAVADVTDELDELFSKIKRPEEPGQITELTGPQRRRLAEIFARVAVLQSRLMANLELLKTRREEHARMTQYVENRLRDTGDGNEKGYLESLEYDEGLISEGLQVQLRSGQKMVEELTQLKERLHGYLREVGSPVRPREMSPDQIDLEMDVLPHLRSISPPRTPVPVVRTRVSEEENSRMQEAPVFTTDDETFEEDLFQEEEEEEEEEVSVEDDEEEAIESFTSNLKKREEKLNEMEFELDERKQNLSENATSLSSQLKELRETSESVKRLEIILGKSEPIWKANFAEERLRTVVQREKLVDAKDKALESKRKELQGISNEMKGREDNNRTSEITKKTVQRLDRENSLLKEENMGLKMRLEKVQANAASVSIEKAKMENLLRMERQRISCLDEEDVIDEKLMTLERSELVSRLIKSRYEAQNLKESHQVLLEEREQQARKFKEVVRAKEDDELRSAEEIERLRAELKSLLGQFQEQGNDPTQQVIFDRLASEKNQLSILCDEQKEELLALKDIVNGQKVELRSAREKNVDERLKPEVDDTVHNLQAQLKSKTIYQMRIEEENELLKRQVRNLRKNMDSRMEEKELDFEVVDSQQLLISSLHEEVAETKNKLTASEQDVQRLHRQISELEKSLEIEHSRTSSQVYSMPPLESPSGQQFNTTHADQFLLGVTQLKSEVSERERIIDQMNERVSDLTSKRGKDIDQLILELTDLRSENAKLSSRLSMRDDQVISKSRQVDRLKRFIGSSTPTVVKSAELRSSSIRTTPLGKSRFTPVFSSRSDPDASPTIVRRGPIKEEESIADYLVRQKRKMEIQRNEIRSKI